MARERNLTREVVLDTAFALAAKHGLEAVSMRAVGERLDVSATALYRHVADKQALLDGLVERLVEALPVPDRALPWEERLGELIAGMRASARRHPDLFMLLLHRPLATPAANARRDLLYEGLRQAGVPTAHVARVERLISTFVIGFAASEGGGRFARHAKAELDADIEWLLTEVAALGSPKPARSG